MALNNSALAAVGRPAKQEGMPGGTSGRPEGRPGSAKPQLAAGWEAAVGNGTNNLALIPVSDRRKLRRIMPTPAIR